MPIGTFSSPGVYYKLRELHLTPSATGAGPQDIQNAMESDRASIPSTTNQQLNPALSKPGSAEPVGAKPAATMPKPSNTINPDDQSRPKPGAAQPSATTPKPASIPNPDASLKTDGASPQLETPQKNGAAEASDEGIGLKEAFEKAAEFVKDNKTEGSIVLNAATKMGALPLSAIYGGGGAGAGAVLGASAGILGAAALGWSVGREIDTAVTKLLGDSLGATLYDRIYGK